MSKNKRDIDKDVMYSKIMPSAARATTMNVPTDTVLDAVEEKAQAIVSSGANQVHHTKTNLYPKNTIAMPTPKPNVLVNLVEYAIKSKLEDALSKFQCCKCDKCKMDVIAITLNNMPSKYIVVEEAEIEKQMLRYQGNVVPAIIKAIIEVKAKPRH